MKKNILVFSNGEKIGDGIIKLPLLHEIKRRLPDLQICWMTNTGDTVFSKQLKNIANQYIDEIYEKANLNVFFWNKISNKFDLDKLYFEYILDTQKAVLRTIALKRIKCQNFISSSASGLFSTIKYKKKSKKENRQYYLEDLFELLDLIKKDNIDKNFKINIPISLEKKLSSIFNKNEKYFGIAPGAAEKDRIWPLENFIEIGKFCENKSLKLVLFLGPEEDHMRLRLKKEFPQAIFPEEKIKDFSGYEIVMGSTKFLSCAIANDSGAGHMLSTNYCPLLKLFGPKDSDKFTPVVKNIETISAKQFGSKKMSSIKVDYVKSKIERNLY